MQSFISDVVSDLVKKTTSFYNTTIILPSQRARVFVKQEFKNKLTGGFLPRILSIEQFIKSISKLEDVDTVELLFHFYAVYKKVETNPDSFDVFASWATTVLQDFNEIDQHLINSKDIFAYLRDIQRLRKWSVNGTFQETDLIKSHQSFLEKLNEYYNYLQTYLLEKNIGYQGMMYRKSCNELSAYLLDKEEHQFYFVGFNALNKAEEFLIQQVLEQTNSQIYWDIDASFFETKQQAASFIKKYRETWKFYEKNEFKTISSQFKKPKNIEVIGTAKNIAQIKYAAEILSNQEEFSNTALVLADETLLPVCINSLPKNLKNINITMGYPLKDIPSTTFIYSIFNLFIDQQKLQKVNENSFYYKSLLAFLNQPFVSKHLVDIQQFITKISKENKIFITASETTNYIEKTAAKEVSAVFKNLLQPINTIDNFLERIIQLILVLKEKTLSLEKEYLFRYYKIFNQLQSLQSTYTFFTDMKTLFKFFQQLVNTENLSFQGEPLKGLQIMGMLETRVLDFENVILVSANEGILPANSKQNSFIPFDVKTHYQLPTYREKDAIFSYHFFRLLQRAKNITIIYNTETDSFGKGEQSRFVTQLLKIKPDIKKKLIAPTVITKEKVLKEVAKDTLVLTRLEQFAKEGFSPSSLTSYLHNPINFYKQKILRIKEFDDVEETVAANTLGNVVHNALEAFYKPFIGKRIFAEDLKKMLQELDTEIVKFFAKENFTKRSINEGKNRLIFEVAKKFVYNFLNKERSLLKDPNNYLKILGLEENLSASIAIDGLPFPIKIHGKVDRIDELNGELRIIDYKTGKVEPKNLIANDTSQLRDENYHKAIQVLLYAYLFTDCKEYDFNKPLHAGIVSFKNLNEGFMKVNFGKNKKEADYNITSDRLNEFILEVKNYILEIYDKEIPFLEAENAKY